MKYSFGAVFFIIALNNKGKLELKIWSLMDMKYLNFKHTLYLLVFAFLSTPSSKANSTEPEYKNESSEGVNSINVLEYWAGTKLNNGDAESDDMFGSSVKVYGDKALIAAVQEDAVGINSGAVYSFELENNQWVEKQQLLPSDFSGGFGFGHSIALDDFWAVVTLPYADDKFVNTGAAFVYKYQDSTWIETQILTADNAGEDDYFGIASAISDEWIMVSAWGGEYGVDTGIYNVGEVYVFQFDGKVWQQTQKLMASDFAQGDVFGEAVAIDGDRALIGSRSLEDNRIGSAYVFELHDGIWTEVQKLSTLNGSGNQYFGRSLDISGNQLLVGAYEDSSGGFDVGSVYAFEFDGQHWNETQRIQASDGNDYDRFGNSISISQGRVLIGAFNDQEKEHYGSAYVFEYDGNDWLESRKIFAIDGVGSNSFGSSVSLSGDVGFVGALFDNSEGNNSGAAFVYMSDLIFKNGVETIQ